MQTKGLAMNPFEKLADDLAKLGAPVLGSLIGTAIGGPAGMLVGGLAGKAIEAVAETLGTDPTPEAIGTAIQNDPTAGAKLTAAEAKAADLIKLSEEETARLKAQLADVQDARKQSADLNAKGSPLGWMPALVTVLVLAGFMGTVFAMFRQEIPQNEVVMLLIGALINMAGQAVAYWLGSSRGSAEKDQSLATLAKGRR